MSVLLYSIRCPTCVMPLSHYRDEIDRRLKKESMENFLDDLKIQHPCCRARLMNGSKCVLDFSQEKVIAGYVDPDSFLPEIDYDAEVKLAEPKYPSRPLDLRAVPSSIGKTSDYSTEDSKTFKIKEYTVHIKVGYGMLAR